MTNNILLIGRLVAKPILEKTESGHNYSIMTIAIPRNYKNTEGIYETDFIDIILHNMVANNTCEYCNKGDIVGIRGRLETEYYENENGEKKKSMIVVADKVTFLSTNKNYEEE